jgi:SpoVK/Ycf46/Vps4 family AAA+-type ATPase
MTPPLISRWTRSGILNFSWTPYETFEKLVLTSNLHDRFAHIASHFLNGKTEFASLQLPWRYGVFLFGPSGAGKTAASRGLARALNWDHFSVPDHEILDAHLFERALYDAVSQSQRIIVLENVERILQRMEPENFFTLLDHSMERAEGTIWIATTRHAENIPKTQFLRPGRFDESIRMELPNNALRERLLRSLIGTLPENPENLDGSDPWAEWIELTQGLTFSHFEELRQISARLKIERREPSEVQLALKSYIEDQLIAGDRLGGLSDETLELQQRVQQIDPRVLMAALDMTDVFRALMEKVIGDATQQDHSASEPSR